MLQTAEIFQNGMVLQRGKKIIVWGTNTPGTAVTAEIQGHRGECVTDGGGNWKLEIPALKASESEVLKVESGGESVTYTEVAVGEVWVAGGQSNMEFWMRYEKHKDEALKDCPDTRLRFYDVPEVCYEGQRQEFDYSRQAVWRQDAAEDLEYFSAVGYYFQKEIKKALDVPVGIIGCNWGGTTASAWMEPDTVRRAGKPWMRDYESKIADMDMEEYWKIQHHNPINDKGNPFADPFGEFILPKTPTQEELHQFFGSVGEEGFEQYLTMLMPQQIPGCLYEHMLKTIAPYSIQGVLWYQGESDDVPGRNILYQDMLTGMIADWRKLWKEELPFLIVQLPGFDKWMLDTESNHYPIIRKCQERTADTVNQVYLCSISDVGEEKDIHPKNKKAVGERLALLARGHVYGERILCDAPKAKCALREGTCITVTFANAEGGLHIEGSALSALQVCCGEETLEYTAKTEGEALLISLDKEVEGTVKLLYAQTPWYLINLYNQAGIPAIPFELEC